MFRLPLNPEAREAQQKERAAEKEREAERRRLAAKREKLQKALTVERRACRALILCTTIPAAVIIFLGATLPAWESMAQRWFYFGSALFVAAIGAGVLQYSRRGILELQAALAATQGRILELEERGKEKEPIGGLGR